MVPLLQRSNHLRANPRPDSEVPTSMKATSSLPEPMAGTFAYYPMSTPPSSTHATSPPASSTWPYKGCPVP